MKLFPVLAIALMMTACGATSVPLTKAGESVMFVPDSDVSGCQSLGMVVAEHGANFKTAEENYGLAENDIRNKAAAKGATHVVLVGAEKVEKTSYTSDCRNCVEMQASAYKCEE